MCSYKPKKKSSFHLSKHWLDKLPPSLFKWGMNIWFPFLGSGIKVMSISSDFREVNVILKSHWYNRNYVGTHFGGSLFPMTDPFYMVMLIKNLNKDYIVWDKAASIQFKRPAYGTVSAYFKFSEQDIIDVQNEADQNEKYVFDKTVSLYNEAQEEVALVTKTLFVQRKDKRKPR